MGTVLENQLHRPYPLFLLGLGITVAYIPGVIGASISTGWLFLLIMVPILFCYCKVNLGLGFAFICYAGFSLFWTENLNIAFFHFLQLVVLGCVFCIGQNIKDLKPIFKGLALGLGVSSILAIAQYFGYTEVYTLNNSIAGLFINPNIYSELSALILISLIVLKLWWWVPVTLPGLILVHSRTAILALGVGLFCWAWSTNKKSAVGLSLAVGFLGAYFYWGHFSISSIQERLDLWADTIKGFNLFGNGVGSYEALFPLYATHIDTEFARPRYAHNDFLNLIFEFGIGSILILMVLFNAVRTKKAELVIIFTFIVISMLAYPTHVPASAFIAFLVTGFVIGCADTNWNVGVNRGSTLFKRAKTEGLGKNRNRQIYVPV